MGILLFAENAQGKIKKSVFEAASYAYGLATSLGEDLEAVVLGSVDGDLDEILGKYGVSKVYHLDDDAYDNFNDQTFTAAVAQAVEEADANIVVLSQTYDGKALGPRLAVRMDAAHVSGANTLPVQDGDSYVIGRPTNSGKGVETVRTHRAKLVVSVKSNGYGTTVNEVDCDVEDFSYDGDTEAGAKMVERVKTSSKISITEADVVISGGRGFKGPENWTSIEEFAEMVGAGTACSKPVADMDWRPHHEHVGQTGIQIAPNLYIAIGISGAIQHLAGVNSSKNIVVINKDPEAPFFKHADYGIVGDLFEVMPRINAAVKQHLASQA